MNSDCRSSGLRWGGLFYKYTGTWPVSCRIYHTVDYTRFRLLYNFQFLSPENYPIHELNSVIFSLYPIVILLRLCSFNWKNSTNKLCYLKRFHISLKIMIIYGWIWSCLNSKQNQVPSLYSGTRVSRSAARIRTYREGWVEFFHDILLTLDVLQHVLLNHQLFVDGLQCIQCLLTFDESDTPKSSYSQHRNGLNVLHRYLCH